MAKLYYGNGKCSIEASENIRGVQIHYKGKVSINGINNESMLTVHKNNAIIIASRGGQGLNNLFSYRGKMKIISIIVADHDAQRVWATIHRVMDFSELLTSNSEDMTTNSEDLKVDYGSNKDWKRRNKYDKNRQMLNNQHTSRHNVILYLEDGTEYNGDYHVHIQDGGAMTGKIHTQDSQLLYIKQINELVPTNDILSAIKRNRRIKRRILKRNTY